MRKIALPSQAFLKNLFDYDADSGMLIWRYRDDLPVRAVGWNTRYAGMIAGSPDKDGYIIVKIQRKAFRASRIIWVWLYGDDPGDDLIDHANRWVSDNSKDNLRRADHSQNMGNVAGWAGKRLPVGVQLRCDKKKFVAKIMTRRRSQHLGSFDTAELAAQAYAVASREMRGEFAMTR